MLADGLREPRRPRWALHAAGDVGRPVEVPGWLDEGAVVRAARGRAAVGSEAHSGLNAPCVRVYDGFWAEWGRLEDTPVACMHMRSGHREVNHEAAPDPSTALDVDPRLG